MSLKKTRTRNFKNSDDVSFGTILDESITFANDVVKSFVIPFGPPDLALPILTISV